MSDLEKQRDVVEYLNEIQPAIVRYFKGRRYLPNDPWFEVIGGPTDIKVVKCGYEHCIRFRFHIKVSSKTIQSDCDDPDLVKSLEYDDGLWYSLASDLELFGVDYNDVNIVLDVDCVDEQL